MIENVEGSEQALPDFRSAGRGSQRLREWVPEASVALGVLLLVLALNAPFFQLPYFWDSHNIISGAAYILANGFKPLVPEAWDTIGHPVLFYESLAFAWLLLGPAPWVSHLVIVGFACVTIYYTYRVGHLLFDRRTGIIAAVLLLSYPLFRAQSTVVLLDLPTAAFAIMAVYFLLKGQTLRYVLCACAMVLTKETGVFLMPAALVYVLANNARRTSWQQRLLRLAVHSLPLFVFAGWLWYHAQATGWWTPSDQVSLRSLLSAYRPSALFSRDGTLERFVGLTGRYFAKTFWVGVLTLWIGAYAFSLRPFLSLFQARPSWTVLTNLFRAQPVWRTWGSADRTVLLLFCLPLSLHLAFLSASPVVLHRYILLYYPLFFLLSARALQGVIKQERLAVTVTAAVALLFTVSGMRLWGVSQLDYLTSPSTLRYTDFVVVHQGAADFIESNYPHAKVLAGWPEYVELAMPLQGYVGQPLRIMAYAQGPRRVERIVALGGQSFSDPETVTLDDFDLAYYSDHTPYADMLLDIIQRFQLPLIAEFRKNAEYVAIYANPQVIDLSASQGK